MRSVVSYKQLHVEQVSLSKLVTTAVRTLRFHS